MKKNTIKAFTLVEMLIVIVIIGILIAALLPRMQAAQWRARDVARKTALSQIQSAIVTHQWDHWSWPKQSEALSWMWVNDIKDELTNAWMTDVPKDPLNEATVSGLWSFTSTSWNYAYMVTQRNWSDKAWFVLMAKTEVAWGSNRVVCDGTASGGTIAVDTDLKDVHPCPVVNKVSSGCSNPNNGDDCSYTSESQLRYIVLY